MSENTLKQTSRGKRKVPRTAWGPGESGNPGVRPREVAEVRGAGAHREGTLIGKPVALIQVPNQQFFNLGRS